MRYKVGDIVTITNKHIDKNQHTPNGLYINSEMIGMAGQKHVIARASDGSLYRIYRLKNCTWTWDSWCFEETDEAMNFAGVEELIL